MHPQLKDYSTVIKTPMWLAKIAEKLQQQLYQTVGEFVSDVQLVFTNCASYNRVRNGVVKNLSMTRGARSFHNFHMWYDQVFINR